MHSQKHFSQISSTPLGMNAFGKVLFKDLSGQLELCAKISPHRREATTFSDEFGEIHHIVNL